MVKLSKEPFGNLLSGKPVWLYTFHNDNRVAVSITNFGGRIVRIHAPDRSGRVADLVLGFDDLDGYVAKNPYFGAIVGRFANRIANAEFTLNGRSYHLARNDGVNSLHGGTKGFDKVLWTARETGDAGGPKLELTYRSPDGDDGYPGNVDVAVEYALDDQNQLRIDYRATTDQPTILNLTNHSYFDLSGQGKGNVLDHVVTLNANSFTPMTPSLVPSGEIRSVDGTPFDFRSPRRIGDRIDGDDAQLKIGMGYDHNFIVNHGIKTGDNKPTFAARAGHPESGRTLEVLTTQPGLQFYSGNHLTGSVSGKAGVKYSFRTGFCLETQYFPDSPHHPEFPSAELAPGATYEESTVFRFSVQE